MDLAAGIWEVLSGQTGNSNGFYVFYSVHLLNAQVLQTWPQQLQPLGNHRSHTNETCTNVCLVEMRILVWSVKTMSTTPSE